MSTMLATTEPTAEVIYPSSDGKRMTENTIQARWIVLILNNLNILFSRNAQVFVACDLLWYPVKDEPKINQAPDVMVVFGRPKGDRPSWIQYREADISPQVVFEILSPSNSGMEMADKLHFYDQYGVEEYYTYDPERKSLTAFQRQGSVFRRILKLGQPSSEDSHRMVPGGRRHEAVLARWPTVHYARGTRCMSTTSRTAIA